jgi:hypothetical protein
LQLLTRCSVAKPTLPPSLRHSQRIPTVGGGKRGLGISAARICVAHGPSMVTPFLDGATVTLTVTPVSCEDAFPPPPHRAGLWTLGVWTLSTPNAEETQSPFSIGFVDSRCGHVSPFADAPPQNATPDGRCRLGGMPRWPSRPQDLGQRSFLLAADTATAPAASYCDYSRGGVPRWITYEDPWRHEGVDLLRTAKALRFASLLAVSKSKCFSKNSAWELETACEEAMRSHGKK